MPILCAVTHNATLISLGMYYSGPDPIVMLIQMYGDWAVMYGVRRLGSTICFEEVSRRVLTRQRRACPTIYYLHIIFLLSYLVRGGVSG